MDGELAPLGQGRPIGARPRSSAGAREPRLQAGPKPGAMVFPPFLPKQKGGRRKGETDSGSNVASGYAYPDSIATRTSSSLFRAHDLKSLCAFTARHFGFGQSNQSHCSGWAPPAGGVPSFRRAPTSRLAVAGLALYAGRAGCCGRDRAAFLQVRSMPQSCGSQLAGEEANVDHTSSSPARRSRQQAVSHMAWLCPRRSRFGSSMNLAA
jgi:hypothetical protein